MKERSDMNFNVHDPRQEQHNPRIKYAVTEALALRDAFEEELKNIYWAERALLIKAIPRMVEYVTHDEVWGAFSRLLEIIEGQVKRIEEVFMLMNIKPEAVRCLVMEGLINEAQEIMDSTGPSGNYDPGLVAAAQKIVQYEITAYTRLHALAQNIEREDVAGLLGKTLGEEIEIAGVLQKVEAGTENKKMQ